MAGDPVLAWVLLGLGVRELSMAPRQIPLVRSVVTGAWLGEAQQVVAEALRLRSHHEVEDLVLRAMRPRFPVELG
jgi:phosphoenolpyruvate-protein kinase (PTS system EI component)